MMERYSKKWIAACFFISALENNYKRIVAIKDVKMWKFSYEFPFESEIQEKDIGRLWEWKKEREESARFPWVGKT